MNFSKIILALAIAAMFVTGASAQTTTDKDTKANTSPMDTCYLNKGSVWIKDSGQAKEYLKAAGVEAPAKKPQAPPTIYQQNGSVWCKTGTVVDREKGIICAGESKK